MRQLFDQMLHKCAIPRLYGLSLLGTSHRVYYGDKATGVVTREFVDRPDARRVLPLDFLKGQWGLDILSPEGFTKIKLELSTLIILALPASLVKSLAVVEHARMYHIYWNNILTRITAILYSSTHL